ncbi:MAG: M23 family metallopeptidase [Tissierellia bacterium]|nr:M23 family metallopeptidase [Tissierellia bacterium]
MVCKHKSEWSYKWAKIKSDYEKFIKYHHPDAKQEYIDERLNEIKAKYDALYDFWGVLQRKGIFKTDTFWYFEPFAWVEQMKRVFSVSKWHDPVDNPQITIFTHSGRKDEANSSFGNHRGRPHTGIDIFTPYRTELYASLKGKVVYCGSMTGYGKVIVIKVDKDELEACRLSYTVQYDKELIEGELYDSFDERFLLYAHLDDYKVKLNQEIQQGELIALSGVTGYAENTHGPHLHFEISCKKLPAKGDGFKYRTNPLNYMKLTQNDIDYQEKYKKPTITQK